MDLLNDVLFADGQDNMAGLTKNAFLAFESSFTSLAVPTPSTTFASLVTIPGNHVLAAGKKMIKLYIMWDKSQLESPSVGARKAKSWKPKVTLFYPGTDAEIAGLASVILNADLINIVEQQEGSGMLQIGTRKLPAYVDASSFKTGMGPEGEKGVMFELTAPSAKAVYFYNGTLPTVGA